MNKRSLALLLVSNAAASIGTGVAMIAVPWLLASRPDGSVLFSSVAMAVNIGLFIATPLIGPVIDRGSRHALMIWLRLAFIAGLFLTLLSQLWLRDDRIALVLYYVLGNSFYAINIPLRTAYVQETFHGSAYLSVNAMLEIENQVAAALTGIIAIFAIKQFGLLWLTVSNVLMYLLAIVCLLFIPYARTEPHHHSAGYLTSLKQGFQISCARPGLTLMLILASVPYVIVILFTVLHPIAISRVAQNSGSAYAIVELMFALGAIIGGTLLSLINRMVTDTSRALLYAMLLFTVVVVLQALFPTRNGFIALAAGLGFGNAVTRVLRQSLIMKEFSLHEAGRISSFLQSMIMLKRALLMSLLTFILAENDIPFTIGCMAGLALSATVIFFILRARWSSHQVSF
jgi:MFS family permease